MYNIQIKGQIALISEDIQQQMYTTCSVPAVTALRHLEYKDPLSGQKISKREFNYTIRNNFLSTMQAANLRQSHSPPFCYMQLLNFLINVH